MSQPSFIGSWRLIDYVLVLPGGRALNPLGEHPYGIGFYTTGGRMSAHLMQSERPLTGKARPMMADLPHDVLAAMTAGYIGYTGTYTIDWQARRISHHVEAALIPDWVGTDLVREFTFEDDVLTLRPLAIHGAQMTLRWQRAE